MRSHSPDMLLTDLPHENGVKYSKVHLADEAFQILVSTGLPDRVRADQEMLRIFIDEVCHRYRDNPFHNWSHAVGMTRCAVWFVQQPNIATRLDETDKFWLLVAALGHAIDHPGFDSSWSSVSAPASDGRQHGKSVAEKFTLPAFRDVMAKSGCDFSYSIPAKDQIRGSVVLGKLMRISGLLPDEEFLVRFAGSLSLEQRLQGVSQPFMPMLLMEAILRAACIYGLVLPYDESRRWGQKLMEEFWAFGRRMKTAGFGIIPIADETQTNFEEAMTSVIQDLGLGLFGTLGKIEPSVNPLLKTLQHNLVEYRAEASGRR